MAKRFCDRFEAALAAIADSLSRPRTEKRLTQLWERIGRLKGKSPRHLPALPHRTPGRRVGNNRHGTDLDETGDRRQPGYPSRGLRLAQHKRL